MGGIYRHALEVIVWLSIGTDFGSLAPAAQLFIDGLSGILEPGLRNAITGNSEYAIVLIQELCEPPYWTRLWGTQEYMLASVVTVWQHVLRIPAPTLLMLLDRDIAVLTPYTIS